MAKIIVTGMCRAGTAETMELSLGVGYTVRGEQWPSWYKERMRQYQPNGYWESREICRGIDTSKMEEDAVKIHLPNFFDCVLDDTDIVIICERDPDAMVDSQITIGYCPPHYREQQIEQNALFYARFDAWAERAPNLVIRKNHEFWLSNKTTDTARIAQALTVRKPVPPREVR